jgi:hypothetical protein
LSILPFHGLSLFQLFQIFASRPPPFSEAVPLNVVGGSFFFGLLIGSFYHTIDKSSGQNVPFKRFIFFTSTLVLVHHLFLGLYHGVVFGDEVLLVVVNILAKFVSSHYVIDHSISIAHFF